MSRRGSVGLRGGVFLLPLLSACLLDIDESLIPGDPNGNDAGPTDGGGGGCPSDQVPRGGGGCIDRTEVTARAYQAFVQARAGDLSGRPASCAFDTQNEPSADWPPPQGRLDHPVVYVDWCDAFAYCGHQGRVLCTVDAWRSACGGQAYPYGATYDEGACQGDAQNPGQRKTSATGSHPDCVGPTGALDLSGNVEEWVDDCLADECGAVGGSFLDPPASLGCSSLRRLGRATNSEARGFRCCSP